MVEYGSFDVKVGSETHKAASGAPLSLFIAPIAILWFLLGTGGMIALISQGKTVVYIIGGILGLILLSKLFR